MEENKYKTGDTVYARVNPGLKLVVRRYVDRVYYCRMADDLQSELVYFERELIDDPTKGYEAKDENKSENNK